MKYAVEVIYTSIWSDIDHETAATVIEADNLKHAKELAEQYANDMEDSHTINLYELSEPIAQAVKATTWEA